ncbi:MAG: urea carboxylase, partial [Pseudomonadales bacterium]|nr:urea carboxylase [Pseudomonadales bacterium]
MLARVLIANRGAIAVRILRTLKARGIRSYVIYSDADRDSLHVQLADVALPLGDGPLAETYLNIDAILALAIQHKIDAIHPGYGFLSENPAFVSACEQQSISFIGPTAEQIQAFGLKHTARTLAQRANCPLLPGSDLLTQLDDALAQAELIGYPVMLKSTAG